MGMMEKQIKIRAIMSVPRVGWNDAWACITSGLGALNIPVNILTGAYWHQEFENALENAVEDGLDTVLTLDYDTMFTVDHVRGLMRHYVAFPDVHAFAAMQCRRGSGDALGTTDASMKGPVLVDVAHFGLTLLKVQELRDVPRPWLIGEPGPDGGWRLGKIDPDVNFWRKWQAAGKRVLVANDVRVGHLEVMVSSFDDAGRAEVMTVRQWHKRNTPGAIPRDSRPMPDAPREVVGIA